MGPYDFNQYDDWGGNPESPSGTPDNDNPNFWNVVGKSAYAILGNMGLGNNNQTGVVPYNKNVAEEKYSTIKWIGIAAFAIIAVVLVSAYMKNREA